MESEHQLPRYLVCYIYNSEEWFFHVDSIDIPILNLKNISLGMNLPFLDYVNTANIALVQGDYECYDDTLLSELLSLNFLVIIRPIVCHEHPAPAVARRLDFGDEQAEEDDDEYEDYSSSSDEEDGSESSSEEEEELEDDDEETESSSEEEEDGEDEGENDEVVEMDENEDENDEVVAMDVHELENENEGENEEPEYDLEQEFQLLLLEELQNVNGEMHELVNNDEEYANNLEHVGLPMDVVIPDQNAYHNMPPLEPDLPALGEEEDDAELPEVHWEVPLPDMNDAELPEVHWDDPGFMGANNDNENWQPFVVNFNEQGDGEGDPIIVDDEGDNDWRGDNDYIPPENWPENDFDRAVRYILNQNVNFQDFLDEHGYANHYNHLGGLANLLANDNNFRNHIINNNLLDNRLINVYM